MKRSPLLAVAVVFVAASRLAIATAASANAPDTETKAPEGVPGTRAGINDAWLSSDAVVNGTYRGVDSTVGPNYQVIDVDQTWMGTPAPGRLVFKAPRGIRGQVGDRMLLFLWDRLAGASDSFLEESKRRYKDETWARIGPDSISVYLLPFAAWSYPYQKDEIVLRGQSVFPVRIPVAKLRDELDEFEKSLQPENLYQHADIVMRAKVTQVEPGERKEYGLVVERWVFVNFKRLETYKGTAPDTLGMRFLSVPRSPRFRQDDDVILFLVQGPDGPFLDQGKRSVLHIVKDEVVEAGRPLSEFLKVLGGP
jgi:hypothetical protein